MIKILTLLACVLMLIIVLAPTLSDARWRNTDPNAPRRPEDE